MRAWKVALSLSLAANAAFAIWSHRQRTAKIVAERELEETRAELARVNAGVDRANIDAATALAELKESNAIAEIVVAETRQLVKEFGQRVQESKDQNLRLAASNDQMDAFIEEHTRHVN